MHTVVAIDVDVEIGHVKRQQNRAQYTANEFENFRKYRFYFSSVCDNMTADAFECIQRVCAQYRKVQHPLEDLTDPVKMKDCDTKFEEVQALHLKQCESIFLGGRDTSLKNMATLGRVHGNVPFTYCADTFHRFRIEEFLRSKGDKQLSASEFVSSLPFYHDFNEQQDSSKEKKIDMLTTLESYSQRFADPLQLRPNSVFVDDLDDILCYIFAVSQMLGSLLEQDTAELGLLDVPFQFDLAILPYGGKQAAWPGPGTTRFFQMLAFGYIRQSIVYAKLTSIVAQSLYDVIFRFYFDEGEDDDEEPYDVVQAIGPALRKFGVKHAQFEIPQQTLQERAAMDNLKRVLLAQFKQVEPKRHGRYVMVVDRRGDEKKKTRWWSLCNGGAASIKGEDEIWIYSPQCEERELYHRLHEDYLEISLLYKTLKCLIPSTRAMMDPHFGCKQRDVITLSFHVLHKDLVKCYMYINDSGARFEAKDLFEILPRFFAQSSNAAALTPAQIQQKFGLKLQDNQFDAWYKRTTSK